MDNKKSKQEKVVEEVNKTRVEAIRQELGQIMDDACNSEVNKTKVEAIRQELGQIMDDTCNSTNYLEIEKRIAKVRIELNLK